VDSIQPASDCEDVEHGQKVALQLFKARGQPAHIFHPTKETFDQIAHRVDVWVVRDRHLCVRLRRDDGNRAFVCDGLANCGAAIGLIGDDGQWRGVPVQKSIKRLAVMGLRASDVYPQGPAQIIYSGVNLTAATAA